MEELNLKVAESVDFQCFNVSRDTACLVYRLAHRYLLYLHPRNIADPVRNLIAILIDVLASFR